MAENGNTQVKYKYFNIALEFLSRLQTVVTSIEIILN